MAVDSFTGLVVPVPTADRFVRARGLHARAHVSLLAPFASPEELDPGLLAELSRFFGEVTPFDLTLAQLCTFPGGTTYLSPEPSATFRRLTHGLHRLFPEFPPYGGEFDDVVPHLTVAVDGEDELTLLKRALPLHTRATRAELVRGDEQSIAETLAEFDFGTTAA